MGRLFHSSDGREDTAMKKYLVRPSSVSGEIVVPSSKSHTLRAILFGALGIGKTVIYSPLVSTDADSMIQACRLWGARIDVSPFRIEIEGLGGKIGKTEDVIHAGNSGIVLRFCSALGALSSHPCVLTGDHSIRHQRPMEPLLKGLAQLGVKAISTRGDGYAPLIIQGPLKAGKVTIEGQDSQYVSALLIAASFADGPIEIEVINPGEKPWVALTLDWLDRLGIGYEQQGFQRYVLRGQSQYKGFEYTVPGDLSSMAFPLAAALVTGSELVLRNVDMSDSQGDKELIPILQKMGACITHDEGRKALYVKKGSVLKGIEVDLNSCVDAITILTVIACFAQGQTRIYNAAVARGKECNRIRCIATELRKMGADIDETDDGLTIRQAQLKGADMHSHHDHRMVMSLAIAAMGAKGISTIDSVECVSKTFPSFLSDFKNIGADMEERS